MVLGVRMKLLLILRKGHWVIGQTNFIQQRAVFVTYIAYHYYAICMFISWYNICSAPQEGAAAMLCGAEKMRRTDQEKQNICDLEKLLKDNYQLIGDSASTQGQAEVYTQLITSYSG